MLHVKSFQVHFKREDDGILVITNMKELKLEVCISISEKLAPKWNRTLYLQLRYSDGLQEQVKKRVCSGDSDDLVWKAIARSDGVAEFRLKPNELEVSAHHCNRNFFFFITTDADMECEATRTESFKVITKLYRSTSTTSQKRKFDDDDKNTKVSMQNLITTMHTLAEDVTCISPETQYELSMACKRVMDAISTHSLVEPVQTPMVGNAFEEVD